jgi:nicotinate-nucleotide pyrophosphorylase (carboxylating)
VTMLSEATTETLRAQGLDPAAVLDIVERALAEDLGPARLDVTTLATVPASQQDVGEIIARADGVVAGLAVAAAVFEVAAGEPAVDLSPKSPPASGMSTPSAERLRRGPHPAVDLSPKSPPASGMSTPSAERLRRGPHPAVDLSPRGPHPALEISFKVADGERVARGDVLATVSGRTRGLLTAERTALNLLCRMSGVATHTRRWADVLHGSKAQVLDTRKTTPGLRILEKYAVRAGGGTNKRMGLYDVAMIKDNHKLAAGGLTAAYVGVREAFPQVPVQVEVTTVAEAVEAVEAGATFLLCDNMSVELLGEVAAAVGDRAELEATGNLTLEVAAAYAATGVDYLSVGGLTHSSPIVDIALDLKIHR